MKSKRKKRKRKQTVNNVVVRILIYVIKAFFQVPGLSRDLNLCFPHHQ